jgi:uncharacterized phage protein gp47/JayE
MFQIKDFLSILAGEINVAKQVSNGALTDFNPGSVVRTLLEANASEIAELYVQMLQGIMDAIPVATFMAFGFAPLPAAAATGAVVFSRTATSNSGTIPAGTVVSATSGVTFETAAAVNLAIGQATANAMVRCTQVGLIGNVPANTITALTGQIGTTGINAVTNPDEFTNGLDAESTESRRSRFQEYIATLARGTKAAVEYGAKTSALVDSGGVVVERVMTVRCIEFDDNSLVEIGSIRVVIDNGAGGASAELVEHTQQVIDGYLDADSRYVAGWKAAGIVATVEAVSQKLVNVTEVVTVLSGYTAATVRAAVLSAQRAYVATLSIGASLIRSELIAAAMAVPGVYNCRVTTPAADVAIAINEIAVLGTVTIT